MELVVVKIIVLLCLGIIKLGSGLMPLLLVRLFRKSSMKWIDNFMAGLMCIGGGVLLATVFIHMLPEVRSSLEDVRIDNGGDPQEHTYPFAELTLCAGFFTIYLIEALVHRIFRIGGHSHGVPIGLDEHGHGHSHETPVENGTHKMNGLTNGQVNPVFVIDSETSDDVGKVANENRILNELTAAKIAYGNNGTPSLTSLHPDELIAGPGNKYRYHVPQKNQTENFSSTATLTSYMAYGGEYDSVEDFTKMSNSTSGNPSELNLQTFGSLPNGGKKAPKDKPVLSAAAKERRFLSSIRSFVIVLALSIHSVFEGMAIGLQMNAGDVWLLFAAVAIHECAILFCVGNEMVNNGMKKCRIVSYMITLGLVTPIGIIIGIVLTSSSTEQTLVVGVMQGLAGGTLLYVTFFEVLEREKLEKVGMTGLVGAFLLILGFSTMAGLEAFGDHDHHSSPLDNSTLTTESYLTSLAADAHGRGHGHSHG